jgi:hypothetical protein
MLRYGTASPNRLALMGQLPYQLTWSIEVNSRKLSESMYLTASYRPTDIELKVNNPRSNSTTTRFHRRRR